MLKKLLFSSLGLVILGAGCGPKLTAIQSPEENPAPSQEMAVSAGDRVRLEDATLSLGEGNIVFTLYRQDGRPMTPQDLKTAHEKKLHLLIVRDDMTNFQHLHPEYQKDKWQVKTAFAEAGEYQMYVDIVPETEAPIVLRRMFAVAGKTVTKNFPEPNPNNSFTVGNITAALALPNGVRTQENTLLNFLLTEDGKPVENILPYLGAFGHVVLLRHGDPDDFFHVHPLKELKPENGVVSFETIFPVPGRYTLYAQFHIAGEVKTFPITIDVIEEGRQTPRQDAKSPHGGGHEQ